MFGKRIHRRATWFRWGRLALAGLMVMSLGTGLAQQPGAAPETVLRELASFNFAAPSVTAAQVVAFKRNLASLRLAGTNALPALQSFLARNQDVIFDAAGSAEALGAPTLRVALLGLLGEMRGPAVIALLQASLQSTADPVELATLGQALDRAEPEKHRPAIVTATRETLKLAAAPQWDGRDVAPLFELLRDFGGATAATEVAQFAQPWSYYAALTLASLPDGSGVPALIQLTTGPDAPARPGRDVFLRGLAEVAPRQTTAADQLLAQAKANQVGPNAWAGIGAALAGNTLHFARPVLSPPLSAVRAGARVFRLAAGNQHVLELPPAEGLAANDLGGRIRLIDRLLAAADNPAASDALEGASIQLSERLARARK